MSKCFCLFLSFILFRTPSFAQADTISIDSLHGKNDIYYLKNNIRFDGVAYSAGNDSIMRYRLIEDGKITQNKWVKRASDTLTEETIEEYTKSYIVSSTFRNGKLSSRAFIEKWPEKKSKSKFFTDIFGCAQNQFDVHYYKNGNLGDIQIVKNGVITNLVLDTNGNVTKK